MRTTSRIAAALVLVLVPAGNPLHAQGGLEGLAGLGDFIGSFFEQDAYVGSTPIKLLRLRDGRMRLQLQGFSVDRPAGSDWYFAYSSVSRASVLQTAWFVKDPHRFTSWAKRDRIPARPSSLVARLEFYGTSSEDLTARVKRGKTNEWTTESVKVLALEARPHRVANIECTEYEARLIDRRAPPGFNQQAFLVTFVGQVCLHPDAPWLAVDVSRARYTPEGEPTPATAAEEEAFIRSFRFDALSGGFVVEDVLLLDRAERPRAAGNGFWIERTLLADKALWVSHRLSAPGPDASRLLSRIDTASNRLTAQVPVRGSVAGITGDAVWVFGSDTAWRLDSGAPSAANEIRITCSPGTFSSFWPLQAGGHGVWLGCTNPDTGKRSRNLGGFLRRIEPTGAPLADLPLVGAPGRIQGDSHVAWAYETNVDRRDKACRLHEINTISNRIIRTIVVDSSACGDVAIAGDEAWIINEGDPIAKFNLVTGRIVGTIPVPRGQWALRIVVGSDVVWVSTMALTDKPESARLGSAGGLMVIDRATARPLGALFPTGSANRLIGFQDGALWLHDDEGAIMRVRERPSPGRQ